MKRSGGRSGEVVRSVLVGAIVLFVQGEDGIRYKVVTGVQTCALPIATTKTEMISVVNQWLKRSIQRYIGWRF